MGRPNTPVKSKPELRAENEAAKSGYESDSRNRLIRSNPPREQSVHYAGRN